MLAYRELLKAHEAEGTLSDAIYAVLRRCIVEGALPPGSRLQPGDLSEEMNVSRTPVREALRRLEAEQYVYPQSRKGLVVRALSGKDLTEMFQIREQLEGLAARLAAETITPIELASLEALVARMAAETDKTELRALTGQFHLQIAEAARNARLYEMIRELQERVRQFEQSTLYMSGQPAEAIKEHRALIEAIKDRDADAAERVAREHRKRTLEVRLGMAARNIEASS
ncbi:MAG: GntR family transcriptional regulator [Rhodospirillales bacterium]